MLLMKRRAKLIARWILILDHSVVMLSDHLGVSSFPSSNNKNVPIKGVC